MEPVESVTPMSILQMAVSQDANIDKLEKLMDMSDRWEANIARKAYVQAMADFKTESIVIIKDKENKQYGSKYTSIGELVNTVTPLLAKHGLSAEWTLDQNTGIKVGCTITHALGHSGETKWMTVPEDSSGAKNPIQKIKSSVTYARILTFEMACGLASKEANLDDDGNGAGKGKELDIDTFDRSISLIEAAESLSMLQVTFVEAYKAAQKLNDTAAMKQFTAAKDKRKAELSENN
jgi:hypothetical protein